MESFLNLNTSTKTQNVDSTISSRALRTMDRPGVFPVQYFRRKVYGIHAGKSAAFGINKVLRYSLKTEHCNKILM